LRNWFWFGGAVLLTLPSLSFRFGLVEAGVATETVFFGIAILGAAFLITWAAEVAQMDISQSLALALIALIAVLPEYSIDLYFAWTAAKNPEYAQYAIANMTGANRLLIGLGWTLVLFIFWLKTKKTTLVLEGTHKIELFFLGVATLYSFTIPAKGFLNLIDAVVLISLFGLYFWTASRARVVEPGLVGPCLLLCALPVLARRLATIVLFVFSAMVIVSAAKPFADGLVEVGKNMGIDEFILVQWVAPLASEAPEITVAAIFALHGMAGSSIGVLVSSKENQWTLLVGALPVAYAISSGGIGALNLDGRQIEEVLLTAAQSAFAIAILAKLRFSIVGGGVLLLLFGSQLFFTDPTVRYIYVGVYLAATAALLLGDRGRIKSLFSMMPYAMSQLRSGDKK